MKSVNLAVVGASGMVGRTFLKVLEERDFPINNFYVFASARSAGQTINFRGQDYTILELTEFSRVRWHVCVAELVVPPALCVTGSQPDFLGSF